MHVFRTEQRKRGRTVCVQNRARERGRAVCMKNRARERGKSCLCVEQMQGKGKELFACRTELGRTVVCRTELGKRGNMVCVQNRAGEKGGKCVQKRARNNVKSMFQLLCMIDGAVWYRIFLNNGLRTVVNVLLACLLIYYYLFVDILLLLTMQDLSLNLTFYHFFLSCLFQVYKTSILTFKNRSKYVDGDFR